MAEPELRPSLSELKSLVLYLPPHNPAQPRDEELMMHGRIWNGKERCLSDKDGPCQGIALYQADKEEKHSKQREQHGQRHRGVEGSGRSGEQRPPGYRQTQREVRINGALQILGHPFNQGSTHQGQAARAECGTSAPDFQAATFVSSSNHLSAFRPLSLQTFSPQPAIPARAPPPFSTSSQICPPWPLVHNAEGTSRGGVTGTL